MQHDLLSDFEANTLKNIFFTKRFLMYPFQQTDSVSLRLLTLSYSEATAVRSELKFKWQNSGKNTDVVSSLKYKCKAHRHHLYVWATRTADGENKEGVASTHQAHAAGCDNAAIAVAFPLLVELRKTRIAQLKIAKTPSFSKNLSTISEKRFTLAWDGFSDVLNQRFFAKEKWKQYVRGHVIHFKGRSNIKLRGN